MTLGVNDFIMNSTSTSTPLIPHLCDRLKASIPNFTDASCKEFLNLNVNNIVSTSPPPTQIPDKCISYCDTDMRMVMNDYNHYYHGYITLIICIFGTIANILNIIILTRKEMSKTPINAILKWLAVCDMLVMIEYIPYTCHQYIVKSGEKDLSFTWSWFLFAHSNFTTTMHTISILLTVTLALWRYIAIKYPHGTLGYVAQNHYGRAVFFCFVLSPILCLSTFFLYNVVPIPGENNVTEYHLDVNEDTQLYRINFWIHSIIIKLLPCIILTVISFVLIDVLCRASKRKLKLKGYTEAKANNNAPPQRPSKIDRRADRTTMLLVGVLILFLITEFPQGILGLLSGIIGKCFLIRCYFLFGEIMDLLALINAAIGFVLYGCMSKQFRATFKSTFCKKHQQKLDITRVTNTNHTTTNV